MAQLLLTRATMCRFGLTALLPLLVFACSSSTASAPATAAAPTGDCTAAQTQCAGLQVQTCVDQGGALAWSAAADCADGQVCRGVACSDLTGDEQQRLTAISTLYSQSRTQGAISVPVDYAALEAKSRLELLTSDESNTAYVQTMWDALMSLPQGHQGLGIGTQATLADSQAAIDMGFNIGPLTVHKACLTPYLDHAVVTVATAGPLHVGDEVVAIDGKRGADLQAFVMGQPDSADLIPPTATGRFAFAIRAFLGRDRDGMVFTVKHAGTGDETDITMTKGAALADAYSCLDPFSRDAYAAALGTMLPDGTGVLYLPGFEQTSVADFESTVGPEFDKVKAAPRLVIDLRGNYGGNLSAALDLVAQLPDAKKADYCEFFHRTPNTDPAAYEATATATKSVDPTAVPAGNRFAYTGKVAILTDGATFSSGEHFILATRAATHALVIGTKTAGAYGTTSLDTPTMLPGTPALQVTINQSQVRTLDGKVLDGTSQEPDIVVEYDPASIAAHQDPMMVRAVAELSK